jgi:hypothetical protein
VGPADIMFRWLYLPSLACRWAIAGHDSGQPANSCGDN